MSNREEAHPASKGGPDVICFSGHDWWYHNRAHSDLQLMTRIARERKVLLVNSIGMRMPLPGRSPKPFRRMFRKALSMLRYFRRPLANTPNFMVMTAFMVPVYDIRWIRELNFLIIRWQVSAVCWLVGIRRPHIFITVPTAIEVARRKARASLVYNRSDIHSAFGEVNKDYITGLETELLTTADTVFYSSHALLEREAQQTGERGYFLDHGLDIEHFKPVAPKERSELGAKGPIIGFFGGLDDYVVDFELIERIAVTFPDATVLLIGDATLSLDSLTRHANVIAPGARPYREIPALGSSFDVAIMPWLQNEWIKYCNPIKLKEYLALELEIVTTYFPEAEFYREHIHIANSHDEFLRLIGEVLSGAAKRLDREGRQRLLKQCRWEMRSDECLQQMDRVSGVLCAE